MEATSQYCCRAVLDCCDIDTVLILLQAAMAGCGARHTGSGSDAGGGGCRGGSGGSGAGCAPGRHHGGPHLHRRGPRGRVRPCSCAHCNDSLFLPSCYACVHLCPSAQIRRQRAWSLPVHTMKCCQRMLHREVEVLGCCCAIPLLTISLMSCGWPLQVSAARSGGGGDACSQPARHQHALQCHAAAEGHGRPQPAADARCAAVPPGCGGRPGSYRSAQHAVASCKPSVDWSKNVRGPRGMQHNVLIAGVAG